MKLSATPIDIYIDQVAMAKIRAWTDATDLEVSGLGLVEPVYEENNIVALDVTEVFILKQECSVAGTELDQLAIAELMVELEREGRANQLKLWWHSHADNNVFWSPTDKANIVRLRSDDFLLSIVVNKSWKILARIDWFNPIEVTMDDLPVHVCLGDEDVRRRCRAEVKALVSEYRIAVMPKTKPHHEITVQDLWEDPFGWHDRPGMADHWPFLIEEEK